MSKTLPATCAAGIVTALGVPIDADILSEGVGSSEGVVILDDEDATYIPKTSGDLDTTLDKLINALTQVKVALDETKSGLQTLAGKNYLIAATAGVPDPAASTSWVSNITNLGAASTAVASLKTELQTLKSQLK